MKGDGSTPYGMTPAEVLECVCPNRAEGRQIRSEPAGVRREKQFALRDIAELLVLSFVHQERIIQEGLAAVAKWQRAGAGVIALAEQLDRLDDDPPDRYGETEILDEETGRRVMAFAAHVSHGHKGGQLLAAFLLNELTLSEAVAERLLFAWNSDSKFPLSDDHISALLRGASLRGRASA